MSAWAKIRGEIAAKARHHPDSDLTDLRRDLALARVEERIRTAVENAPPLPDALALRLVELIATSTRDGAGDAI